MRVFLICLIGFSSPALAEGYCQLDPAARLGLAAAIAGDWQGEMVQGVVMEGGKPQLLPTGGPPLRASFVVADQGLRFTDPMSATSVALAPSEDAAAWDYALPGESEMFAAELLDPVVQAGGISCAVADLPGFRGTAGLPDGLVARFHVYAATSNSLMLVMQVGQPGPVAADQARALRVVMRYSR